MCEWERIHGNRTPAPPEWQVPQEDRDVTDKMLRERTDWLPPWCVLAVWLLVWMLLMLCGCRTPPAPGAQ